MTPEANSLALFAPAALLQPTKATGLMSLGEHRGPQPPAFRAGPRAHSVFACKNALYYTPWKQYSGNKE